MMDMMDSKTTRTAAVVLCCLAAVAFGTIYTWTGEGSGPEWQDQYNWDPTDYSCTPNCYPHTIDDDGLIDMFALITLSESETIDDLCVSIVGEIPWVTFRTAGATKTVTCETITISSGVVYVTEQAGLLVNGSEPCE